MSEWSASEVNLLKDRYHALPKHELIKLFPGRSFPSIKNKASKLGLHKSEILKGAIRVVTPQIFSKPTGLSEIEIRAKHDNIFKIRQGCKQLKKGYYLPDQQMRELCKVGSNVWRGLSERDEFNDFKFIAQGGKVYWGTPEGVRKLSEDINGL
jgi:hypothetical protein